MPKINLNVVIVCGSQKVDLGAFTQQLTESYLPKIHVEQQNGCTLTRTIVQVKNSALFNDLLAEQDQTTTNTNNQSTQEKDQTCELDICFWDMNPKEHLWSRIKALQLYETANIFLMVYNADDRDSFEKLLSIHNDFKEQNAVGAYQVLVSVITKDIATKHTKRFMKHDDVQYFMEERGIPSFIEVRLDTKKNMDLLDYHLKFLMNPSYNSYRQNKETAFLYRPLFQTLTINQGTKKKKAVQAHADWVDRLYYQKPDYGRLYKQRQKQFSSHFSSMNASHYRSSKILPSAGLESSPPFNISIAQDKNSPPTVQELREDRIRPVNIPPRHSVIDLLAPPTTSQQQKKKNSGDKQIKVSNFYDEPGYESDKNLIDKRYLQTVQQTMSPPSPMNSSKQINKTSNHSGGLSRQFHNRSNPNLLLHSNQDLRHSPHKEDPRIVDKLKEKTRKKHADMCPYHARHSRSRSPKSDDKKKKPFMDLNSYMSKKKKTNKKTACDDGHFYQQQYYHNNHGHQMLHSKSNMDLDFEPVYNKNNHKDSYQQKRQERERSFSFEPPQENFYLAPPRLPRNFDPSMSSNDWSKHD
eukprot:403358997